MFRTVKNKFAMVYIGLVAIIVLLGLISVLTLSQINRTINNLITTNYNSITRISNMRQALWEQNVVVMEYLYGLRQEDSVQLHNGLETAFTLNYEEERETIVLPNELVYIEGIGVAFAEYCAMFTVLQDFDLEDASELQQAHSYYYEEMKAQQATVEENLQLLYASNEAALFERRDQAVHRITNSLQVTTMVFLVAAVGGYWLSTVYTKRFFSPLYQITENIRLIRQGNLKWQVEIQTQDEFGMLSEEFGRMVHRLAEFERSTLGVLNSERNRAESLVKSIHQPMILLDEKGCIVTFNEAFKSLFQLESQIWKGQPLLEAVTNDGFREYVDCLKQGILEFEQDKTITVQTEQEELFFHISATPVPGLDEKLAGLIVILHDITEIMQLEKLRGNYIATISHEFKTPLTSIVMGADLLSEELLGKLGEEQKEIIETIKEDSQRLETLVSEILELSRIESAKMIYRFEPCAVESLLESSINQFKAMAERNQITLQIRCPGNLPSVHADFSKITWVLNNLLSNAFKYTKAGDTVSVEAGRDGEWICFSVADTGVGIPAELAHQVFEKYVQIKGYDIEVRGSGLGLAAAREIIDAHGGHIWCDPHVEVGSRFVFQLKGCEGSEHQ